ncbi:MAG: hypothetical protein QM770_20775 [Tepidisphaeraceae bacterium]
MAKKKKKKSKLNKRLLLGVITAAVAAVGLGFVGYNVIRSRRADAYLTEGKSALQAKNYKDASASLLRYGTSAVGRTDAEAKMLYVQAAMHRTSFDEKVLLDVLNAHESALALKPDYKDALESYLKLALDLREDLPPVRTPEVRAQIGDAFSRMKDYSEKLLKIDPGNAVAIDAAAFAAFDELSRKGLARTMDDITKVRDLISGYLKTDPDNPKLRLFDLELLSQQLDLLATNGTLRRTDIADEHVAGSVKELLTDWPARADAAKSADSPLSTERRARMLVTASRAMELSRAFADITPERSRELVAKSIEYLSAAADIIQPSDPSFSQNPVDRCTLLQAPPQ